MLKTSQVTQTIKNKMSDNGYNNLSYDMKFRLLKNEIISEICEELHIINKGEFSIEDIGMLLDMDIKVSKINKNIFSSYIYAVINIMSEIQGSIIFLNQEKSTDNNAFKINYDEYGFIQEIRVNKEMNPSIILAELINNLESKPQSKLLVK